jgi:hypothetical protein
MWPWEHLAVGYLVYSLGSRIRRGMAPVGGPVIALALGTQVPDLVDKPLSWGLGVFSSGFAVGHSAFVALPLGTAALLVGKRSNHRQWIVALVVGYWSHLVADVLNPLRYAEAVRPGRVLWPVADVEPYDSGTGLGRGVVYLEDLLGTLTTVPLTELLVGYLLLPAVTIGLWIYDGAPGLGRLRDLLQFLWDILT